MKHLNMVNESVGNIMVGGGWCTVLLGIWSCGLNPEKGKL